MRRLLIRPGGIGDTILSFPAMECLRADYTEIWVRSEIVPLIRFADRVRALSSTGIDLLGIPDVEPPARLIEDLGSFCQIVSWYGANRLTETDLPAALREKFRFLRALPEDGGRVHAADFFLSQAGGTGPAVPCIDTGVRERSGYVVLHPFSGSQRKNWPLNRFSELERMLTAAGHPVEWAARPDWVRFENLWDLARWLAGAACYIGNDTGITHLAAAVGTPVVALFGPTDPAVWAPRGGRVRIVRGAAMEDITAEQVYSAASTSL